VRGAQTEPGGGVSDEACRLVTEPGSPTSDAPTDEGQADFTEGPNEDSTPPAAGMLPQAVAAGVGAHGPGPAMAIALETAATCAQPKLNVESHGQALLANTATVEVTSESAGDLGAKLAAGGQPTAVKSVACASGGSGQATQAAAAKSPAAAVEADPESACQPSGKGAKAEKAEEAAAKGAEKAEEAEEAAAKKAGPGEAEKSEKAEKSGPGEAEKAAAKSDPEPQVRQRERTPFRKGLFDNYTGQPTFPGPVAPRPPPPTAPKEPGPRPGPLPAPPPGPVPHGKWPWVGRPGGTFGGPPPRRQDAKFNPSAPEPEQQLDSTAPQQGPSRAVRPIGGLSLVKGLSLNTGEGGAPEVAPKSMPKRKFVPQGCGAEDPPTMIALIGSHPIFVGGVIAAANHALLRTVWVVCFTL